MASTKHTRDIDGTDGNAAARQESASAAAQASTKLGIELDLQDCREEVRRLQTALKQLRSENLELNRALGRSDTPDDLRVLIEDQAKRLDLMRASLSWRITAPLRMLARLFGAD
ncbi:MAG TPA: hypothetical protein VFN25_01250 [Dokdonella sp.]|uniref:hypothetical protein n=1 Tax=Dokdonella sp. TaxID=2291710 RepID=UPI002D7FAAF1|nr:hypothetical protein [Dokdonella sp.]HET9031508.1 hypothetical protein [Dokdonella sp.]